ncbi:hypothetical protein BsWGS_19073 [Bradybaena similaris]
MFPHMALGLLVLTIALCLVSSSEDCTSVESTQKIQTKCRKENEAILMAEDVQDFAEVCRHYTLLMLCAVSELPHCYDYIEMAYSMYGHSPFSCQMTAEQIQKLQQIINAARMTSTPHPTTSTTSAVEEKHSSTTFLNIFASSTLSSAHNVTAPHPGSNEKHKGGSTHDDGSVVTPNISAMTVLLMTTPLLWWLTS